MFTAQKYVKAGTLDEAWQLNQSKGSHILGGMQWMKMSSAAYGTVIDLSGLGLDKITETEGGWQIGCMVTLRRLEECESLEAYTDGALKEALRHIVGVQFRNMATIGGTVAGKYGFSDVLTILRVMDVDVELYHRGKTELGEFLKLPYDNDIVTGITIHRSRTPLAFAYRSMRNTETDLPTLTCAAVIDGHSVRFAIGARPGVAVTFEEDLPEQVQRAGGAADSEIRAFADAVGKRAADAIPVNSNMRGSAEYRKNLTEVLIKRNMHQLLCGGND
ncbi:MAG: FAD binding domain-containing protein [Lachnospiraceae bacterium]|jgi:CO/xanthine dehydrogenase FAD-binding subunit|nr:FAD binding domain-containing protein [Lachnospiraceae bacterium]MCH4031739.1 FAD binding domain-containing protein [Lachnospiraceae bacterium]MCH4071244.1 FAD binding domain-containing protein [Lachnospiraceae bacterium]MCH4108293.1 FAD binding domain-containing protein [Lachnospiraceae bacterium]MCI1302611.1 FAD binding domain-containing protein [Lachnospiraceae bacterium]